MRGEVAWERQWGLGSSGLGALLCKQPVGHKTKAPCPVLAREKHTTL